jgi:hypothetical protein
VTFPEEEKKLLDCQKKNDPHFNISEWMRAKVHECFSEEETIKQEWENSIKTTEELANRLKSFEEERQNVLDTIYKNRFWWVRTAYIIGLGAYPKVIQKYISEYRNGSGIKLEEKNFLKHIELVKNKYSEEIQQISDNPNLIDVEEYKKLKRVVD